jgi:hypothetical protein
LLLSSPHKPYHSTGSPPAINNVESLKDKLEQIKEEEKTLNTLSSNNYADII